MKCAALAVLGALLTMTLRRQSGEFAVLLGVAAVCMIGITTMALLRPVLSFVETLQDRAELSGEVVSPVLRTLAIGFVAELGKGICQDAGEPAIGNALQLFCGVAALYALLPLLQGVLTLLEQIL